MADPMVQNDDTRAALSSPAYRDAFEAMARGEDATLTDDERAAVRTARQLTGTPAPGMPMPITPATPPDEETT